LHDDKPRNARKTVQEVRRTIETKESVEKRKKMEQMDKEKKKKEVQGKYNCSKKSGRKEASLGTTEWMRRINED
jgi:imidazole glycerol phosphate synthase subunit HisF